MIYILLLTVFSSGNLDASTDINDLLLDDKLNPSDLPLCSDNPFKLCFGYLKYSNADYVGALKNNVPNGYGTLTFSSGEDPRQSYLGQFKNGKAHGQGNTSWPNGDSHTGSYKNGKAHGQGKTSWPNGDSHTGSYKKGNADGLGTTIWSDGSQYIGHFLDNKRHGQGKYTYLDGRTREGTFVDGRFQFGVERSPSGSIREGTFVDGKLHDGFHRIAPSAPNSVVSNQTTPSLTGFTSFLESLVYKLQYFFVGDKVEIKNGEPIDSFTRTILKYLMTFSIFVLLMVLLAKFNLHATSFVSLFIGLVCLDMVIPLVLQSAGKPSYWIALLVLFMFFLALPLRRRKRNVCPKCGTKPHFFGFGKFEEVQIEVDDISDTNNLKYSVCPMCRHKWQSSWNSIEMSRGTEG